MFSILLLRASSIGLSEARIWSGSACILAVGVASSRSEEALKAGLSGPLVSTKLSSESKPNSLNGHANCTVGLFLEILIIPLLLLGLAGWIRVSLETQPPSALLNCLPTPRPYDVCTISSIHQTGVEAG
jgi:hypothetical protein